VIRICFSDIVDSDPRLDLMVHRGEPSILGSCDEQGSILVVRTRGENGLGVWPQSLENPRTDISRPYLTTP